MKTLKNIDLRGKRILIRLDLNSSIIDKKVQDSLRFKRHSKTLKKLSKKQAKIVILAHQGKRTKPNYLDSLDQHSKILSKHLNKKVIYVNDLFGKKAIQKIKNLQNGQILLLKNTRSYENETKNLTPKKHSESEFVKTLSPFFDLFIQDAFSVCHRNHASIVGFPYRLPSYPGDVLNSELKAINKIDKEIKKPFTLILGGKKVKDYLDIIRRYSKQKKADYILTTGVPSLIACKLKGIKLGKEDELLKEQKTLMKKLAPYKSKLITPTDFAYESNKKRKEIKTKDLPINKPLLDIGSETIKEYSKIIKKSKTIFIKGTAGFYEKKGFEKGTKMLFKQIRKSSGFSLSGGGDTLTALKKTKGIDHISLSGGALLKYLANKKLPGLKVLK